MTSIEEDLHRKDLSELEDAKRIEAILSGISPPGSQRLQLNSSINELNDIIKSNESVRERGLSALFYAKLGKVLAHLLENKESDEFWTDFEVVIKCLRNSAAAFKADVNPDELAICQMLLDFLREESTLKKLTNRDVNDTTTRNCLVFVLQYFFNLSQGNLNSKLYLFRFKKPLLNCNSIRNLLNLNYSLHRGKQIQICYCYSCKTLFLFSIFFYLTIVIRNEHLNPEREREERRF